MANATFPPALPELQASLWSWTRQYDPTSNLYAVLAAFAKEIDSLGDAFDLIWQSRSITTAQVADLIAQYAYVWGVAQEQLPPTQGALAAYIQARAGENGSKASLANTLTMLIGATAANFVGGAVLTFDPGGAGLTFPDPNGSNLVFPMSGGIPLPTSFGAGGAGLTLYQFAPGAQPSAGLIFPANGAGLVFPTNPLVGANQDQAQALDGTSGVGAGQGLTFANNPYVSIVENFAAYSFTVQVKSYLAFDRGALARAVERFRPAHCLPAVIQEINTT